MLFTCNILLIFDNKVKMNTYQPKQKEVKRAWHKIDAEGQVLGRLSTKVAALLMGKGKITYSAHMDSGDYVVIINAEKIKVTGKKEQQKKYYTHSGYPGGFREIAYSKLKKENPTKIVELAVKRMLPSNRLRDKRLNRLKIVVGSESPYLAKVQ
jgi:large subunit ribosomal protein L13